MKLSKFKSIVAELDTLNFALPNGDLIPAHYHVTEVGNVTKNFIDCGGTVRNEKVVNFQLWYSVDVNHRLQPQKMLDIIDLSERKIGVEDNEIEVEYQSETIGKYGLDFDGKNFILTNKETACLAGVACGIIPKKVMVNLVNLTSNSSCCTPESGCC